MRKILNYLLGEELVNGQSDRELKNAITGLIYCWVMMILCFAAICIFG